ncbi:MAG: DUF2007 domain-containing protein [Betaproteobacteria bacterium]|jgi:hypothetical protein|nr:DUF2007 domain-containing protein [Betaproteobacteria bacterium]
MLKRLYAARHLTEAHLIRGHLESCGIAATVRGEALAGGFGELPLDACSVWVDDSQFDDAEAALRALHHGDPFSGASSWICASCGERSEPQFSACWRCGGERPDAGGQTA